MKLILKVTFITIKDGQMPAPQVNVAIMIQFEKGTDASNYEIVFNKMILKNIVNTVITSVRALTC